MLSKPNAMAYPIVFLIYLSKWCESLPKEGGDIGTPYW
jgi:hypothetical protein